MFFFKPTNITGAPPPCRFCFGLCGIYRESISDGDLSIIEWVYHGIAWDNRNYECMGACENGALPLNGYVHRGNDEICFRIQWI